jgi:hypothetical protein
MTQCGLGSDIPPKIRCKGREAARAKKLHGKENVSTTTPSALTGDTE